ncbi:hypothetical protein [Chondromyces apiculatus]|nr:hypothetical protein [Chondromyces apiculatus]
MKSRLHRLVPVSVLLGAWALAACGADPKPPPPPPPAPPPAAAPEPEPEPEPAKSADAAPDAAPAASPSQSAGRPPLLKSDSEEITDSFGSSPPAKLELGDDTGRATLRIPENALSQGVNITFKIEKKGKSSGPPTGKIYRTSTVIPPDGTPQEISSAGPSFELAFPAGNKKDANLAIGKITTDDKGKEKIEWSVVAPTKIDDTTGLAHFELKTLPNGYLHITTKAPTEPKQ